MAIIPEKNDLSVHRLLLTSEDAVAHVKKMSNHISKPHKPKNIIRKEQVALAR
jgi:hypothetical protein